MNDLITEVRTEEWTVACSVLQFPCSAVDSNHQGPPNASDALLRRGARGDVASEGGGWYFTGFYGPVRGGPFPD